MFIARCLKFTNQHSYLREVLVKCDNRAFIKSRKLFSSLTDEEEDTIRRKRATRFVLAVLGTATLAGFFYLGRPDESSGKENEPQESFDSRLFFKSIANYYRRAHKRVFSTVKVLEIANVF
jgi:hypothetical protein